MPVETDGPDGPDALFDGGGLDEVEWLEHADGDEVAAGPAALPAGPTRRRVAGSLLLAGAVLAATGYGAAGVYHRDRAADLVAEAAADELILAAPTSGGISLPGLDGLGPALARTSRLSTEIAVPLVNRGPAAVTLLPGATLLGPGLTASHLGGDDATVLGPGRSTVLRGSVTVDCAESGAARDAAAGTSLTISARTSGGGLGVGTVTFAGSAAGSVRDRVCAVRDGG
ncbi:hypothetical protein [Actinospica robiniae]|uniref:hypothetical protein n=1 Tax=Actinospica robiniae TaxID=304901 RepID=UPI00040DF519|nr:hypothetical protein [Actinospica robiniae]